MSLQEHRTEMDLTRGRGVRMSEHYTMAGYKLTHSFRYEHVQEKAQDLSTKTRQVKENSKQTQNVELAMMANQSNSFNGCGVPQPLDLSIKRDNSSDTATHTDEKVLEHFKRSATELYRNTDLDVEQPKSMSLEASFSPTSESDNETSAAAAIAWSAALFNIHQRFCLDSGLGDSHTSKFRDSL